MPHIQTKNTRVSFSRTRTSRTRTSRTRASRTRASRTHEHGDDISCRDVSLTTTAEEAKKWQEHGQKVHAQLLRKINIRIKQFERAVGEELKKTTNESKAEVVKDQKSLRWWNGALEKLSALDSASSLRDATQVVYLESCIDGMMYAENVEEGEKQLAELRGMWDEKKRELVKIESKMKEVESWMGGHNEQFKRRLARRLAARPLMKLNDER